VATDWLEFAKVTAFSGHVKQNVAALEFWNVPMEQARHGLDPMVLLYVPKSQGVQ